MPTESTTYLHIGLPKTGTTFVQGVLAANAKSLSLQGLVYPGRPNDHFLAAQDVMGHDFRGFSDDRTPGSWQLLLDEVAKAPESSLISHEMFSLASTDTISRILAQLPPGEVRVVVTARDFLRQVPAVWQEDLKNGKSLDLAEFVSKLRETDGSNPPKGFWRFQDLPAITARWAAQVGGENLTLVTVPAEGSDQHLLWERFALAVGLDAGGVAIPERRRNTSLGAEEAEFLRRLNVQLEDDLSWPDYRTFVKHTLVNKVLAKLPNTVPIALEPDGVAWAVERSQRIVQEIEQRHYRVVGDLADLVSVPSASKNLSATVGDADVTEVGVAAITGLLQNINRTSRKERTSS